MDDPVAVVRDSIFVLNGGNHLIRIDTHADQIVANIATDESQFLAGDDGVWLLSGVGFVPGPDDPLVRRFDLDRNRLVRTELPSGRPGLGGWWTYVDNTLTELRPEDGSVIGRWPLISSGAIEVGCGGLWIRAFEAGTLTWFDPAESSLGTPIDVPEQGIGRVHEMPTGCYAVIGNPGDTGTGVETGLLALIDATGIVSASPLIDERVHFVGDTLWTSTAAGRIHQIDPMTADPVGPYWQLPQDDIPSNPKFNDWQLVAASGDLYFVSYGAVTHLDIAVP